MQVFPCSQHLCVHFLEELKLRQIKDSFSIYLNFSMRQGMVSNLESIGCSSRVTCWYVWSRWSTSFLSLVALHLSSYNQNQTTHPGKEFWVIYYGVLSCTMSGWHKRSDSQGCLFSQPAGARFHYSGLAARWGHSSTSKHQVDKIDEATKEHGIWLCMISHQTIFSKLLWTLFPSCCSGLWHKNVRVP